MKLFSKNITEPTLLFTAMLFVNAGNYFINLILGRFLGPEAFAEVSIIATIVLMLSFIAVGIQLTSAKFTAEATNKAEKNAHVYWISNGTFKMSLIFSIIFIGLSPVLKSYLNFDSTLPFVIIGCGLPVFFGLAVKRGSMQGLERFKSLAGTYATEMLLRMSMSFALIYLALSFLETLTTAAVALGFVVSFFASNNYKIEKSHQELKKESQKTIIGFLMIIGFYELSQIIINNSDVIMIKHFFNAKEAGIYAAIALIGRVVFFGTWTIVTLLFPKVIQREKEGLSHIHLFWGALSIVAICGLSIVAICYFFPVHIISILFGNEYTSASDILWLYAFATSLFACANVFAYYHMSLKNYLPVIFTMIAGCLQMALINVYHASLTEVIMIQLYTMGGLFILMLSYHQINHVFKKKKEILKIELN